MTRALKRRRLVLFDCDGTLVDSQHSIVAAMTHAFEAVGLAPPERIQTLSVVGLSVPEAIATLTPGADSTIRVRLAEEFRAGGPAHRAAGGRADPLYAGALDAIASLSRRDDVVLGVATGKSRRGVKRLCDQYGWHAAFATIQTADTNPSKPDPGMILTAIAETGVVPQDTVMIGDTSYDMAMARAAGVQALGVAWGYHDVDTVRRAGAHDVVDSFDQLLEIVEKFLQ